jgi:hypothetical protein
MRKSGFTKVSSLIPPFSPCANCSHGWVYAKPTDAQYQQPVRRCPCWLAHQQRILAGLKGKS